MSLFSVLSSAADNKESAFWHWFEKNEERLFAFEKDQAKVFDELSVAMNKVHRDLTFEFGPIQDARRDFVISAGGIKKAFPAVEKLYAAAPKLKHWTIIKFRPRRMPINDITYAERKVKAKDVDFVLFKDKDPAKVGVVIFINGYREEEKASVWGQIGYSSSTRHWESTTSNQGGRNRFRVQRVEIPRSVASTRNAARRI